MEVWGGLREGHTAGPGAAGRKGFLTSAATETEPRADEGLGDGRGERGHLGFKLLRVAPLELVFLVPVAVEVEGGKGTDSGLPNDVAALGPVVLDNLGAYNIRILRRQTLKDG